MPDLTGQLSDFSLSEVVCLLGAGKKTGVLRIEGAIGHGTLNFNEGTLIHITEDEPAVDSLTEVMLGLARIPDATFAFEAGVVSVGGPEAHHEIGPVVTELAKRLAAWSKVEARIGSALEPYVIVAGAEEGQALDLTGTDWNLLAALGDGSSAAGLARRTDQDEFDIAIALGRFLDAGLIAPMPELAPGRESTPAGSGGTMLVEPHIPPPLSPEPTSEVILDLTVERVETDPVADDEEEISAREEPASALAARWRDLRASRS